MHDVVEVYTFKIIQRLFFLKCYSFNKYGCKQSLFNNVYFVGQIVNSEMVHTILCNFNQIFKELQIVKKPKMKKNLQQKKKIKIISTK